MPSTSPSRADTRSPLEVGHAIAGRFMKTPRQDHYMWDVGLAGILDMYEASREQRYLDFYLGHSGGDKSHYDFRLATVLNDKRFLTGAREAADRHLANPHRDREGCLLDPRGRYTVDVLSGLFPNPLVLGHVLNDAKLYDDALVNFEIHRDYLEDPETGLWWSRWGHSLHPNRPNPGLWSRGNGWLCAAWGKCAHLWDPKHAAYAHINSEWRRYCTNIAKVQAPAGTYHQLLVRTTSFHEASGTALCCTGMARGVLNASLPREFSTPAYRAFCGLRALIDERGNIHNGSTFAGGYNFEWQYETCAYYNEPHATATAIAAGAAADLLLKAFPATDITPPAEKPPIITKEIPGVLMIEPPTSRPPAKLAAPVLDRVMTLMQWPANDLGGGTIHGMLDWYDQSHQPQHLERAAALLELAKGKLNAAAWWNAAAALAARRNDQAITTQLRAVVDAALGARTRDRNGIWVDDQGGYSVAPLYYWLPLLGRTGALTGDTRYFDEAAKQLIGHGRWLEDSYTHLWYSAFGHGKRKHYVSPGLWAMGNGLLMSGLVDLLAHLPRDHPNFVDAVVFLRHLLAGVHTYFPVSEGWRQIMDHLETFNCTGAAALFTYASAKAILNKWDHPAYYAITWGGNHHLCQLIDDKGNSQWSSNPTGGMDTIEAWQAHKTHNDPAILGYVLSGAAGMIECDKVDVNRGSNDGTRGAR